MPLVQVDLVPVMPVVTAVVATGVAVGAVWAAFRACACPLIPTIISAAIAPASATARKCHTPRRNFIARPPLEAQRTRAPSGCHPQREYLPQEMSCQILA
jgi:hypothetical protein